MATVQRIAHLFRIMYIILFVFSSLLVLASIDPSMFEFTRVFEILNYLLLFIQEIMRAFGALAFFLIYAIAGAKSNLTIPILNIPIPFISDPNFGSVDPTETGMRGTIDDILNPLNSFFPHSTIDISDEQALMSLIEDFSHFFGATAILILLPIALLSGIGFLREGDTKLAIYSFLGFQLIIIIAIFTQKILISTAIDTAATTSDPLIGLIEGLVRMIFSPLFTLGFLLYLLLEIAFQTSYTLNIIEPMTEREKRIRGHLRQIRSFVPPSEEVGREGEQSVQSVQSKKFDLLAASYLREMVERRVFKRGETARDVKSTMRLQSYLASLSQSDPRTDSKLAAQTAQPDISAMLKYFVPAMIFRMVAVIFLSYSIMAPEWFLRPLLAGTFPALLQSLELTQPEFRTIAILNVALIFILLGFILKYLTSGRTIKVLERVVQQIDTLVDFDRGSRTVSTVSETIDEEETEEETEELPSDDEEEIS